MIKRLSILLCALCASAFNLPLRADPPAVPGAVPISRGGTGATSASSALSALGALPASKVVVVTRTADAAGITGSTTPAPDGTLQWSVAAGETWQFEMYCYFTDSSSVDNYTIEVSSSQTVTMSAVAIVGDFFFGEGALSFPNASQSSPSTLPATETGSASSATDGGYFFLIKGSLTMGGTGGTVGLSYAQASSTGDTIKLKAGSYLRAFKQ